LYGLGQDRPCGAGPRVKETAVRHTRSRLPAVD